MVEMQRRSRKNSDTMTLIRDWRQALQTPHIYRVGNSALRVQSQFLILFVIILLVPIVLYTYPSLFSTICSSDEKISRPSLSWQYNDTYPITTPIKTATGITYSIAIISDLDLESKKSGKKTSWISYLKKGKLFWMPQSNQISVSFSDEKTLSSHFSLADRGMELSELVTFDGQLVSFDDRTGLVYLIDDDKSYPWVVLMDGNGKDLKGFKSEWATVKDKELYIGSMGKEWTSADGIYIHSNPMWIKIISPRGEVRSVNWIDNYKKLRQALNIEFPGYMIHESGVWSSIHNAWFFLPRRCSKDPYNETQDEMMSCNVLLRATESFEKVKVIKINNPSATKGFSSFKFLPGSNDTIIVALKSEEFKGDTATYITAFNIDGTIFLEDTKIATLKFEGLEFV